jgi:membrane associated rhomboid family serine protease
MIESPRFAARPATSGLIAVCSAVFVFTWVAATVRAEEPLRALLRMGWTFEDAPLLDRMGALSAVRVWLDGEWWRVVSAGLLHGSWVHLGLNMIGLWAVGHWTEKLWGGWRQLALFWISSIGGCLASLAWAEAPLVVGASAGIFGVAGALVIARAWGRPELREAVSVVSARSLGFWLVFWLAVGALLPWMFGISLLAQAGHLGGLLFGVAVGFAYSVPRERRLLRALLWGLVALGLVGLGVAARAPSWRPNFHVFTGAEQLARGEFEAAAAHFDQALLASPDDVQLANAVAYSLAEAGVDLGRAETLVRQSLVDEPDSADYLDTLGWILCRQGRADEGRAALEQAQAAATREIPEIQEHLDACGAGAR